MSCLGPTGPCLLPQFHGGDHLRENDESRWLELWFNQGWHLVAEMHDAYPGTTELRLKAASLIRMAREIVQRAERREQEEKNGRAREEMETAIPPYEVGA